MRAIGIPDMTDALRATVEGPATDPETLLDLLADDDVRELFETADEPRTIPELAAACDLARSTAYRKVTRLVSAGLLAPTTPDAADTGDATAYRRTVDRIELSVGDETAVGFA